MAHLIPVLVQTPAHSQIGGALTYRSESPLTPGTLVRVPLGRRETLGVVWDGETAHDPVLDPSRLRPVSTVLDALPPLGPNWRQLVAFAARYYQRAPGEVGLSALPPPLRDLSEVQLQRRLRRKTPAAGAAASPSAAPDGAQAPGGQAWPLSAEQQAVMEQLRHGDGTFVLFGATGSGKTEVYLQCVQELIEHQPDAQALIMVPEINLTPQLQQRFLARFAPRFGTEAVVSMHSGMTHPQRLRSWLAAHMGTARIVLGTRMAIFASMPRLQLIVVDEEHDPSYKQQEGARYSARDLAIYRGQLEKAKVILGSATPSLESWYHSRPRAEGGRYTRLHMPSRVGDQARLPLVRRVDMNHQPRRAVIAPPLLEAIRQRVAAGEQSLVLLNRRGYAPVLQCGACDWKSACPHCSAYRVFHKIDRSLRCHHCGFAEPVPRACPECGNLDIAPIGRGTEQLQEHVAALLSDVRRPGSQTPEQPQGLAVNVARIDADSTRLAGSLQTQLAQVHSGEVDVLVGTQMVAKGHDFRRITLVAALNADNALFSSDFRAPERLFSLLMQAAGRAGRDAAVSGHSEMWIQTFQPQHPLFDALKRHDYPAFAEQQLQDRAGAGLPPFSFQALLRAEARTQEAAQGFLEAASAAAQAQLADLPGFELVTLYPAVPMTIQRVANVERAQMLVESPSRKALQGFLAAWHELLHAVRQGEAGRGLLRWAVDVDPLAI
ncbi:primosomal protein N' [Comamonadaceae bacterium G21597-S1]|nr:primosomal protein N' [Comamonadaceae bacterium G21597-S1]